MKQKFSRKWKASKQPRKKRKYKDIYFMYKANLNPEPLVYIASRNYTNRTGIRTTDELNSENSEEKQIVKIYSNLQEVELFVNEKSLGKKMPDSLNRISWEVPFANGKNKLVAKAQKDGKTISDELEINFVYRADELKNDKIPFTSLKINVGTFVEYIDNEQYTWHSDKEYTQGNFGFVEGKFTKYTKNRILS